ncbi:LamG-like jellyroll fold domain-containing protein [Desulfovibrio gilichinskyi]|uniref:Uncharacterized protein n=1 Tax=Desulfovibrio gilichinskyi TaxID=1519643 RepID=A0A1X7C3P2_9BACT|nr:LamG-like jellyroll fold domain-containing protein [Desulfovibrio gilichinskyi]SME89482.1 hypothetical protein SAMN06295933_0309 [Desulfovibrio gilichinskyi]
MAENDYTYSAPNIDASPGGDSVKSSILEKNQARVEQIITHLNTHKNRTATHGVVSAIVGTEDTQILSNKTLADPIVSYAGEPALNAPVTRAYVEGQSNLAVTQAGVARDEAVVARNEAVAARDIAVDAAAFLKISDTPILSGLATKNEGETLTVEITNHEAVNKYLVSVSGGTFTIVGGIISWILPNVDIDTSYNMTVFASKDGYQESKAATHTVLVKYVPIQEGPTMAFANTVDGWPGATIDGDGIQPPAYSGGLVNENQIVTAQMEVEVTSGQKTVLDGTTATFLKVLEELYAGMLLVTDKGNVFVESVESSTVSSADIVDLLDDGSCVALYNFNGSLNGSGEAASSIVPKSSVSYITGKVGQAVSINNGTAPCNVPVDDIQHAGVSVWTNPSLNSHTSGSYRIMWLMMGGICGVDFGRGSVTIFGQNVALDTSAWKNLNKFINICITSDGKNGYLYIDKTLVKTITNISLTGSGALTDLAHGANDAQSMDQLRVFNRTLTQDDVDKIYEEGQKAYSCIINLPAAPAKVFKNPLQGETLVVSTRSTATSLETNQLVKEGESLFLDGVEGVAGATSGELGEYPNKPYTSELGTPIESANVTGWISANAFDGDIANRWAGLSTAADLAINGSWIGWKFKEPISLEEYSLTPLADPRNLGATINLRASNDGVTWTTIQTDNSVYAEHSYPVASTDKFTHWAVSNNTKLDYYMNVLELAFKKRGNFSVDITSFGLTTPPQYASRKIENIFAIGVGNANEYIGPEIVVEQGEGSTASKLVLTSAGSIAAKIFVEGGLNNNILCDGQDVAVASVSEEIVDGISPVKQIIPDMTGETTDGCTITASRSDYGPAYACWKVGKANQPSNSDYWQANGYPTDLVIAFDSPKTISKYSLISAFSYVQNSQTWALYKGASLTGPWTLLHQQAAAFTWSSTGGGTQTLNFDLGASHTANYFKLNCGNTAQHGYSGLGRVRLFGTESKKMTKTIVNLETPLDKVPAKVAIPDCYSLTPAGYISELSDGKLKLTVDKIEFPDNPELKQLAMSVRSPEDMRFTDGKIYIQEKP